MAEFPMTLCNCQKQRNEAIFKAAAVYNVPLRISTSKSQPILQQRPSADTRKFLSQYFPSQSFSWPKQLLTLARLRWLSTTVDKIFFSFLPEVQIIHKQSFTLFKIKPQQTTFSSLVLWSTNYSALLRLRQEWVRHWHPKKAMPCCVYHCAGKLGQKFQAPMALSSNCIPKQSWVFPFLAPPGSLPTAAGNPELLCWLPDQTHLLFSLTLEAQFLRAHSKPHILKIQLSELERHQTYRGQTKMDILNFLSCCTCTNEGK